MNRRITVILDGEPVPDEIARTLTIENEIQEVAVGGWLAPTPTTPYPTFQYTGRQRIQFGDAVPLPWSHPPHPWTVTLHPEGT